MWRKVLRREGRDIGSGGPERRGFFLAAGATRGKRLFECPSLTMKYFFDAVNAASAGELCYRELDEKGAVLKHPTALAECREAGRRFAGA